MLVAEMFVKFFNKLLCVVVDWVVPQHGETVFSLIKAHVVKELCEDHTERAQSITLVLTEELRIPRKDIFVHLKDHLFVLTIFLESLFVLSLKQTVLANWYLVRVFLKLEEQVDCQSAQVAGYIHD